jgi:hypothetical protein
MSPETDVAPPATPHFTGSTPRKDEARRSITRTTITPAPGNEASAEPGTPAKRSLSDRLKSSQHGELTAARPLYPGTNIVRLIMATLMSVLSLLTVGGAVLLLLLWQQDRASGVLSTQVDRTWELFDMLRQVERLVAFAVIPVAVVWIALATVNVFRATGKRRDPFVAAASLPVGLFGIWIVGAQIVAESGDWVGKAAGFVLQLVFLAVPLLALERVAHVAEARHRPLRATYVIAALFLAATQFLGGLSTVDQSSGADTWGPLGAYLVIVGLLQVLGALSINEAQRAIEEATEHRYQLRQRFGESLLAQAEKR